MSLCVINGTSPNIVLPADSYADKTCSDILNAVNHPDGLLAYTCPYYTEVLKLKDCPLKMHHDLIIQGELEEYPAPSHHLKIIPESDKDFFWIEVEISCQLKEPLPTMLVSLDTNDFPTMTVQDILLACKSAFGYDFTEEKLSIGDKILEMTEPAEPILQQCRSEHIKLSFIVGDAGKKKIGARGHITAEIISTEETYNNDLKMLLEYWEPAFKNTTAFAEGEVHSMFREVKTIASVHNAFLEDLKKIKPGFIAEMSYVFLKHLQNFTKAKVFVSAFKPMDDMMKKKRMVRSVDKQISEIETNLPVKNGRNFMSYYVTPVQRYPRYPLLFRELDKCTPSFHPEKHYIVMTMQKLNEVNKNIDQLSHKIISIQAMQDIQDTMPSGIIIMDHGREIIEQAVVRIVSNKRTGPGVIYLFNNLIMLAYTKKRINTPLFQLDPTEFRFANCKPALTSIYTSQDGETYQIDFNDLSEKTTWMDQYHNLVQELYKDFKEEKPVIKWTDVELSETVTERVSHDGCLSTGFVYYFGGTNESRSTTSNIIRYNIADSIWSIENTPVPPRESHSISALRGDIYVAFGNNSNKIYGDIWTYNQATRAWTECVPKNAKPSPRFGHTCTVYESKLYFFGGKLNNKSNDKDGITNSVSYFDPHTNEYHDFGVLPNSPPPRYLHAAVLVNKTEMAIIGGNGLQTKYDDVWVLDLTKMTWSRRSKVNVNKRHDCKAAVLGDRWIFVHGGLLPADGNATSDGQDFMIIDGKNWLPVDFAQFGNYPPELSKHSLVTMDSHRMIVFGGTERVTHRSYPSAWILNADDALPKMAKIMPTEVDPYWEKELIQEMMAAAGRPHRAASIDPSIMPRVPPNIQNNKPDLQQLANNSTSSPSLLEDRGPQTVTPGANARHTISGLQATPFATMQPTPLLGLLNKKGSVESPAPRVCPIEIPAPVKRNNTTRTVPVSPVNSEPPLPPPPPPAPMTAPPVDKKKLDKKKDDKKKDDKKLDKKKDDKKNEKKPEDNKQQVQVNAVPKEASPKSSINSLPVPMGISAADLANSRINLRRQKSREELQTPQPKGNGSKDYIDVRSNYVPKGDKFNMQEFYNELGIDVSGLNFFEANATKIKSSKFWQKAFENKELFEKVSKLENLLTGNVQPPAGMSFIVKVFDDNSRTVRIVKIKTETTIQQLASAVESILQKNDAILTVAVGKGRTQSLSPDALIEAMRSVYKGTTRCITLNAI